ncbi:hypothetical protein H8E88_10385 [candidate division KSB1 bacterium]|nr:hypothetical protein [candidate division KSB1 bacterium]MBL7093206.1 hypothetical protein [candidate division KSB1 bacterium]
MVKSTRREFIKKTISGAVGSVVAGGVLSQTNPIFAFNKGNAPVFNRKSNRGNKPNLLYIFCDQLRFSAVGASGNKIVKTPNHRTMEII